MKKTISLILVFVLCTFLFACGSTNNVPASTEAAEQTQVIVMMDNDNAEAEEEYQSIIFDEPVVLCDDPTVKIVLTAFYEEHYNWADRDSAVEKGITLQFTNKTEDEIQIEVYDVYLGDYNAQCMMTDGSPYPAPGKTATHNFIFQNIVGNDVEALESIEDLYQLNGEFTIINFDTGEMYTVPFSFAELQ